MESQVNEQSPLLQVAACKSAHTYNFFKIGCIKSKSTIVVLFWTFLPLVGYSILNQVNQGMIYTSQRLKDYEIIGILVSTIFFLGIMFISPMVGLLADIKFGRYKTVRCSSYITLAVMSFLSIYCLVSTIVTSIATPHYFLRIPFLFVAGITLLFVTIGVLITSSIVLTTNAINFGMDQLHDSSTQDSILFVHWYVWLNYLSLLVTGVPWSLYFHDFWYLDYVDEIRIVSLSLYILIFGIFSFLLIVSMCAVRHRRWWFSIESGGRVNPYKLVYRVVKFAWHHKIPVRRSAFTYCEDEWPSRLDLGKQKYGGPFTVEQVKDVRTFLGIFKVLISIVPLFMLQFISESSLTQFAVHHNLFFKPSGNNSLHNYGHMIRTY